MPEANVESAGRVRDLFFEAAISGISWENALDALTGCLMRWALPFS